MKDTIDDVIRDFTLTNTKYPPVLRDLLRKIYDSTPRVFYSHIMDDNQKGNFTSGCGLDVWGEPRDIKVRFFGPTVFGRKIFWFNHISMKVIIDDSEFYLNRRTSLFFYYYFSVAYRHYKNIVSIETYQKMEENINIFLKTEI